MKFCIYCKKAMFTSSYSIWIKNINYPCHKICRINCIKACGIENCEEKE